MHFPATDSFRQARILVVDDEPHIRRLLVRWLEKEGHVCREADDGRQALARLEAESFDVVFTDLRMPGMGGLELLEVARERDPELAILVVTGLADRATPVLALEKGAWGWISKPFDQGEIQIQLLCALRRRELERLAHREQERLEEEVRRRTADLRHRELELAERLVSAAEVRDDETGSHIRRIGILASRLAETLGWRGRDVEDLRVAAMMHDLGKIGVPDRVLLKPGPLTPDEVASIRKHTLLGARLLEGSEVPMLEMAREIALCHHERWDGRGYPRGLVGEQIPEAARIVSVVDVYDALTHDRVYRAARSVPESVAFLRGDRGRAFDPRIVDAFLEHREALVRDIDELGEREAAEPDAASDPIFPRVARAG